MSDPLPQKTVGDHLHSGARAIVAAIPLLGGPALEFLSAVIVPPIERRRNEWWNDLADRLHALDNEKRLKLDELGKNEEFISAVMNATTAMRTHQSEKIAALRNAVLNSSLGKYASEAKGAIFLALVDQFSVWHLLVLRELSALDSRPGQTYSPKTSFEAIARAALEHNTELRSQEPLVNVVVEDLCRKGLVFWGGGAAVTYISQGTKQVTPLGHEFLKYVSEPEA